VERSPQTNDKKRLPSRSTAIQSQR